MSNKRIIGRYSAMFLACTLGVPTCCKMLEGITASDVRGALATGACLGVLHLFLRPVIRAVTIPIGCLTLGLINPLIDLALLYAAARFTGAIEITNLLSAVLTSFMINAVCFIAAGRS